MSRTGYLVRCITHSTRFDVNEILEVTSVSSQPNGKLLLGLDGNLPIWDSINFEEVQVYAASDDSMVVWEPPEPTIEITRKEYLALLDAEMWWHSALLGNVRDYCGWSDIVEHYQQIKKEEKGMVNDN